MSTEVPTPPNDQTLVYRGIGSAHNGAEIGRWWSTNPYYALRYANGGAGDMFVATVDDETLVSGVVDASLEENYQNYIFKNGDPTGARKVTDEEIQLLRAATTTGRLDDDFPGGTLIKWPENAAEIGREIFLPKNIGATVLLQTIEPDKERDKEVDFYGEVSTTEQLASGVLRQKPTPEVLKWLMNHDSRVHYFPPDEEIMTRESARFAYYRAVADKIGQKVYEDFPGTQVAVRGTTAALVSNYPFWQSEDGNADRPMNTVLDILRQGTDTGEKKTRVGYIDPPEDGATAMLNPQTHEWLTERIKSVNMELILGGKEAEKNLRQTFPVLIVYDDERSFADNNGHGWRDMSQESEASEHILAVYITDNFIQQPGLPDNSEEAQKNQQPAARPFSWIDLQ